MTREQRLRALVKEWHEKAGLLQRSAALPGLGAHAAASLVEHAEVLTASAGKLTAILDGTSDEP